MDGGQPRLYMAPMSSLNEIRSAFLGYFSGHDHRIAPAHRLDGAPMPANQLGHGQESRHGLKGFLDGGLA